MSYVKKTLGNGEKIIYTAQFHWTYMLDSYFYMAASALFSIFIIYGAPAFLDSFLQFQLVPALGKFGQMNRFLSMSIFLIAALKYSATLTRKFTTEIVITNRRLVHKRGLWSRRVESINVQSIEGVNIQQSIFGRLTGFGRLAVRGTGIGDIHLPPVKDPLVFRKALLTATSKQ